MSGLKTLVRRRVWLGLRRAGASLNKYPKFFRYFVATTRLLGLYPVACIIYARIAAASRLDLNRYGFIPSDISHLSSRARQIHADLKAAIESRQRDGG